MDLSEDFPGLVSCDQAARVSAEGKWQSLTMVTREAGAHHKRPVGSAQGPWRADLHTVHSYLGSQQTEFRKILVIQTCKFALMLQYPATEATRERADTKASDDL